MWLTKQKKGVSKKQELKKLALIKLASTLKKSNKRYNKKYFDNLIKIFRIFLEKRFKIKRGLTHEEILSALKERKVTRSLKYRITRFSYLINEIEYADKEITKEVYQESIEKLKDIIKRS